MSKIKVRLVGGLGNQLYQFGFALLLLERFGYEKIIIDCSDMDNYKENWGYMLSIVLDDSKLDGRVDFGQSWVLKSRFVKLTSSIDLGVFGLVSDNNYGHVLEYSSNSTLYLDGYFSHEDHTDKIIDAVKPYLRDDLFIDFPDNALVVNVRGGEYARLGWASPEDAILYKILIQKALAKMHNPIIHLVTDDVEYSESILSGFCDIGVIHEPNPVDNFCVLISARHKILSKSTFSKWAGYLSSEAAEVYYIT